MQIPSIDLLYFKTIEEKQLKIKVRNWVKENLRNRIINIKSKPLTIELTWQGLKNDIYEYHNNYIEKLVSFGILYEIIEQAEFLYSEKDKKKRKEVKAIHRFKSKVKISDKEFDVIIIIVETITSYLYDHILLEKK